MKELLLILAGIMIGTPMGIFLACLGRAAKLGDEMRAGLIDGPYDVSKGCELPPPPDLPTELHVRVNVGRLNELLDASNSVDPPTERIS